jgi:ubiquinone/menaquinone biosynthesis C-methylase UbiE
MSYNAAKSWGDLYSAGSEISYPAEGVIRIFKGKFPELKMKKPEQGDSIVDVGCGDGRHLPLFYNLGMKISAVEISNQIRDTLSNRMHHIGVPANIQTGHAANLPFKDNEFDYLLSWNSCYYMSLSNLPFEQHVNEMARVIKPGGWIVCSIPKKTSFIFDKSVPAEKTGYRIIKDDYFGSRNGEVMRCMESRDDMVASFASRFENFCHADLDMNWFGLAYHWHIFCAQKI